MEAERIMAQLQSENERQDAVPDDGSPKYMPSTEDTDPIVRALKTVLKCKEVTDWELLDSRWNGNEALRWTTDRGPFFVKMNRVEDMSVFMTEAVSLSALAKADVMQVPKPLHLGVLPKVGEIGPGAFMILEHLALVPFGPMRPGNQAALGNSLADLHLSKEHDALHQGRFGFPVSNFLALTPLNNAWCDTWTEFFKRRMSDQIEGLLKDKAYGRAALVEGEPDTADVLKRFRAVEGRVGDILEGATVTPSLLHGDLWIGNTGATIEGPCMFDPASFFGHSEFELAIMEMFGGFQEPFWTAYHDKIPKAEGFERRQKLYKLYHYLNQLNLFGDPKVRETVETLTNEMLSDLDG
ncbi:fructosamine 3 kinase related protein [Ectocarpus siliculosus]|uniref:protein-ribulosamine 3-kinase n=1 Tax=Ectocarpus siliculosus TaxID=2880 RepID=D8LRW9_ECTSI|nr:fructosamine 3 kinase related protein [Ectocarpus siliculosus]|eukprot:CBN73886.1 fructosamine 3 kinase related protein [Ectocarpus siliculosus]